MNGLLWILLLCCCGKKSCNSVTENRYDCVEKERPSCSLKERENVWTPYMGNNSDHDYDCGCEHNH